MKHHFAIFGFDLKACESGELHSIEPSNHDEQEVLQNNISSASRISTGEGTKALPTSTVPTSSSDQVALFNTGKGERKPAMSENRKAQSQVDDGEGGSEDDDQASNGTTRQGRDGEPSYGTDEHMSSASDDHESSDGRENQEDSHHQEDPPDWEYQPSNGDGGDDDDEGGADSDAEEHISSRALTTPKLVQRWHPELVTAYARSPMMTDPTSSPVEKTGASVDRFRCLSVAFTDILDEDGPTYIFNDKHMRDELHNASEDADGQLQSLLDIAWPTNPSTCTVPSSIVSRS